MSQTKNTDNSPKTNSDEIARSIIQPIVDQAAGEPKGGGTKPPLHHNTTKSDTNNNNPETNSNSKPKQVSNSKSKDDQSNTNKSSSSSSIKSKSKSSNDNFVFHPNHPGKMYELSSVSTAGNSTTQSPRGLNTNTTDDNKKTTEEKNMQNNSKNNKDSSTRNGAASNSKSQGTKPPKSNSTITESDKPNLNSKQPIEEIVQITPINDTKNPNQSHGSHGGGGGHGHGHASSTRQSTTGRSNSSLRGVGGSSSSLSREQRRERRRKLEDPNCFPKRFEVQVQARVRVGMDLSSQHLTDLPEGSVVTVEEIINRRARISRPLCGWLSVTSKFGARIILPTNSKYSKIGGKVMFKRPIQGQQLLSNGQYPNQAKIVDYNEENALYKVNYEDGNTQWIDLENPNVQFISQHKAVKVQKPLDGAAPTFTLQTSQAFFNQFFCKDYPQYQAQSSSTTRHMDISPVSIPAGQTRFNRFPPPHTHTHGHGPQPPTHLNGPPPVGHGHGRGPPQGPHGHGPPGPHGNPNHPPPVGHPQYGHPPPGHVDQRHPGQVGPNRHGYPPSHPSSRGQYPTGPHGHPPPHGYVHNNHGAPPGPHNGNIPPPGPHGYGPPLGHGPPPTRGPPIPPHGHIRGPPQGPHGPPPNDYHRDRRDMSNGSGKKDKKDEPIPKTTNEEFVNKVKEIERRIIQHLHQRGYDESHPDYHRYLQKAKELAIQKAGKEREKMLQQQREIAAQQSANQNKGVTRQEYEQYMRYRQEKQTQRTGKILKFDTSFEPQKQTSDIFIWGKPTPSRLVPQNKALDYPYKHDMLSQKRFIYITAAKDGNHFFGITQNGWSFVWGESNFTGSLGLGNNKTKSTLPFILRSLKKQNIIHVSCSSRHGIAVTAKSIVYGWGSKLLTNLSNNYCEPQRLEFLDNLNICSVDCCQTHSAVYSKLNTDVYSFGLKGPWLGLLDENKTFGKVMFEEKDDVKNDEKIFVSKVCVSNQYTMYLFSNGVVYANGINEHGRMGCSKKISELYKPMKVLINDSIGEISLGPFHAGFVSLKNELYTCGVGADYRLGHGTEETQFVPILVQSLTDVKCVRVECVEDRTYVITEYGAVVMFGVEPVTKRVYKAPHILENLRSHRVYQICGTKDCTVALGVQAKEKVMKPSCD